jgi:hypothetical protein
VDYRIKQIYHGCHEKRGKSSLAHDFNRGLWMIWIYEGKWVCLYIGIYTDVCGYILVGGKTQKRTIDPEKHLN